MGFSIQGYKGLQENAQLEVADLTVLIGKNGSGKSSFIQLLKTVSARTPRKLNEIKEFAQLDFEFDEFVNDRETQMTKEIIFSFDVLMDKYGLLEAQIVFKPKENLIYSLSCVKVFTNKTYQLAFQKEILNKIPFFHFDRREIIVDSKQWITLNNYRYDVVKEYSTETFIKPPNEEEIMNITEEYLKGKGDSKFFKDNNAIRGWLQGDSYHFRPINKNNEFRENKHSKLKTLEIILEEDLPLKLKESAIQDSKAAKEYHNFLSTNKVLDANSRIEIISQIIERALKNISFELEYDWDYMDYFKSRDSLDAGDNWRYQDVLLEKLKRIGYSEESPFDEMSSIFYELWCEIRDEEHDLLFKNNFRLPIEVMTPAIDVAVMTEINRLQSFLFISHDFTLNERYVNLTKPKGQFDELVKKWFSLSNDEEEASLSFINMSLKDLEIAKTLTIELFNNNLFIYLNKGSQRTLLFDEGSGIIMLVQILIALDLAINKNREIDTVVLEEPETNLHPALQSKLADLFADAVMNHGVKLIIETHSEYLIRKLQYLIARGKMNASKAVINYFEMREDHKGHADVHINHYYFDEQGKVDLEFKEKFMDESHSLKIELYKTQKARQN